MHRLILSLIVLVALSTGALAEQPKMDRNLGTTGPQIVATQHYQEWGYQVDPGEYVTCIAYFAIGDTRFTKAPTFTNTWVGETSGWSTAISPDRKAVYLFGPRSHFGPNINQPYGITYNVYYDTQTAAQDTIIFDGGTLTFGWHRSGTTGNGTPGTWSHSPTPVGGPYSTISTNWINMGLTGVIFSEGTSAYVGEWMQVGPKSTVGEENQETFPWGTITSYSASPGLPQVGGDLNKYGWGMRGTIDYLDIEGRTHISEGNWWIYYTDLQQFPIEEGTYIIKTNWPNGWSEPAVVTGNFIAASGSTVQPPWPADYADWSCIGVAGFTGTFSDPNTLTGVFSASDNKLILKSPSGQNVVFAQSGQDVLIRLHQQQMTTPAAGYQAFVSFDTSMLSLATGSYAIFPYGLTIIPLQAVDGKIDLAAGYHPGFQEPTARDARLADFTFKAGSKEGITQVIFRENLPGTRFSDDLGDVILTQTVDGPFIIVDNTPPTDLSIDADPTGWTHSGPITLIFSANDALSGIGSYNISYNGSDNVNVTSPCPLDATALETGDYTVTLTALDKAGNTASATTTIHIDKTPPAIETEPAAGGTVTTALHTITGTVSDQHSGVESLTLSINGSTPVTVDIIEGVFSTDVLLVPGANALLYTLTDKVGNVTTKTLSYTYEQSAPTVSVVASLAPSESDPDFSSPSLPGWIANYQHAVINGLDEYGTGTEQFKHIDAAQDYPSVIATGFGSWKGVVDDESAEFGTSIGFVYVLENGVRTNPGAKKLDLAYVGITGRDHLTGTDTSDDDLIRDWADFTWNDPDLQSLSFGDAAMELKGYNWDGTEWVEVTSGREADLIVGHLSASFIPDISWGDGQTAINALYKRLAGALPWVDSGVRQRLDTIDLQVAYQEGDSIPAAASGYTEIEFATADEASPVITIESPVTGSVTNASGIAVTGTAADDSALDSGVKSVVVSLNGGEPVAADSDDFFATWTANLDLTDAEQGENQISATVTDFAGNTSSTSVTFIYDTVPPVITIPDDVTVPSLPDSLSAIVDPGMATAIDGIDPAPAISWVRSDGADSLNAPYTGVTTITWTAVDAAGNSSSGVQTITVLQVNRVTLTVELESVRTSPTRPITFIFGGEAESGEQFTVTSEVQFNSVGIGIVTIDTLPAGFLWTKVSAKDAQHTLRSTVALTVAEDGTQYLASFIGVDKLIGGDLTDDNIIDIRDFGVFAGQYGTSDHPYEGRDADINCDGDVWGDDFTYIQIHFTKVGAPAAGGAQTALSGRDSAPEVKTFITVAELATIIGEREARKADLNGDGIVDERDIALSIAKGRD